MNKNELLIDRELREAKSAYCDAIKRATRKEPFCIFRATGDEGSGLVVKAETEKTGVLGRRKIVAAWSCIGDLEASSIEMDGNGWRTTYRTGSTNGTQCEPQTIKGCTAEDLQIHAAKIDAARRNAHRHMPKFLDRAASLV